MLSHGPNGWQRASFSLRPQKKKRGQAIGTRASAAAAAARRADRQTDTAAAGGRRSSLQRECVVSLCDQRHDMTASAPHADGQTADARPIPPPQPSLLLPTHSLTHSLTPLAHCTRCLQSTHTPPADCSAPTVLSVRPSTAASPSPIRSAAMEDNNCRMYEGIYPNAEDLVVVQVKNVAEMGAYVSLLEYNGIEGQQGQLARQEDSGADDGSCRAAMGSLSRPAPPRADWCSWDQGGQATDAPSVWLRLLLACCCAGMILLSELSRRRIRSINKLIRVGRTEIVVVLRVDKEKGRWTRAEGGARGNTRGGAMPREPGVVPSLVAQSSRPSRWLLVFSPFCYFLVQVTSIFPSVVFPPRTSFARRRSSTSRRRCTASCAT